MRLSILVFLLLIGCARPDFSSKPDPVTVSASAELNKVTEEFSKIGKEDQELLYKQIRGAALFLEHTTVLKNSEDFDPILLRVSNDFNWSPDKYPDFTNALAAYLESVGYDDPVDLDDKERKKLYQTFYDLAEALKYE